MSQEIMEGVTTMNDSRLDVTWIRIFVVWWGLTWRGFLWSYAFGFVLGFLGFRIFLIQELGGGGNILFFYITSIPASLITLRQVLNKRFGSFSLVIVSEDKPEAGKS